MPNDDPLIQLKLSEYLNDFLGDNDYKPIDRSRAIYLEAITHTLTVIKIQWTDEFSAPLVKPILWRYKAWHYDNERQLRLKEKSRLDREAKFVFDANVETIKRQLMKEPLYLPHDVAAVTAHKLMRKGQMKKITTLGVNKLFNGVEEL